MAYDSGIEEELEWRSKRPPANTLKCANCEKPAVSYIFDTPSCEECGRRLLELHKMFNTKPGAKRT